MTDEALASVEHEIWWHQQRIPIGSGASRSGARTAEGGLPAELVSVLALLEREVAGFDLARSCGLVLARELARVVGDQALSLSRREDAPLPPPDLGALPVWDQVELVAAVVASRLTYDHAQVGGIVSRLRSLLAGTLTLVENPVRRARRLLRSSTRGVCRDYAAIMTTVIYALRRTSRAPARMLLPCVMGDPILADGTIDPRGAHVWNLLVEPEAGTLHAIDVTWADWNHEATPERDFSIALADTSRHRHVSALLASLAWGYGSATSPLRRRPEVEAAFAAIVDVHSARGQLLLLHLAEHLATPADAAAAIRRWLVAVDFERVMPGWNQPQQRQSRLLRGLTSPGEWNPLLERLGVPTSAASA